MGFATPLSFREVNQALLARIAAYQGDLVGINTFLNDSFFDLDGSLDNGAYYVFSAEGNDIFIQCFCVELYHSKC